ncbi:MAG: HAMP domain-containing protein [Nitriliruptorales bacterium]|nr:HAMP domain-containing protein [Nitriliruptorales bacterium]
MNVAAIDQRLTDLYERHGSRALDRLFWATTIFSAAAALVVALVTVRYLRGSTVASVGTVLGLPALVLLASGLVGYRVWKDATAPIRDWLDGTRDPRTARLAQDRTLRHANFVWSLGLVVGLVAVVGPYVLYMWQVFALDGAEVAVVGAICLAAAVWVSVLSILVADVYYRPVRTALAAEVGGGSLDSAHQVSIRARILVSMPLISLLTGAVVAMARTFADGNIDELARLLWMSGVTSLTMGLLLTIAFTRALVRPLADIVAVVERVEAGDHSARVDVTTDDEFGLLAITFNEMLAEREQADRRLRALRARIIDAADDERRRIDRNIHDGAQQRLVALVLRLRMLREVAPEGGWDKTVAGVIEEIRAARGELQDLASGLLPAALRTGGLKPALEDLVTRCPVPVEIAVASERFSETVESTVWFMVAESLANMSKHARARAASVAVQRQGRELAVLVSDDGEGGANASGGSGLAGLADRIQALGGSLDIQSPPGRGTRLLALLPDVVE